jgi:uncharacterized protein (DUF302 family)
MTESLNNGINNGMVQLSSRYSVPETLARLESLLKTKGLTIF